MGAPMTMVSAASSFGNKLSTQPALRLLVERSDSGVARRWPMFRDLGQGFRAKIAHGYISVAQLLR